MSVDFAKKKRRRTIARLAMDRGVQLQPAACTVLETYLDEIGVIGEAPQLGKVVQAILESASGHVSGAGHMTAELMSAAVDALRVSGSGATQKGERVRVVELQEVPTVEWSPEIGGYVNYTAQRPKKLFGHPNGRNVMQLQRLQIIRQRLHRHSNFRSSAQAMEVDDTSRQAVCVLSSLTGRHADEELSVLGRLVKSADGKLFLEDDTRRVRIKLTDTILVNGSYTQGLFHEGAIVLACGHWADEIFHCTAIGMPSAEPREESFAALPNDVDFFGLAPPPSQEGVVARQLQKREAQLVVFAAHIHADAPGSLARLTSLIRGLTDPGINPSELCIVLAGDFSQQPFKHGDVLSRLDSQRAEVARFSSLMDQLAEAIVRGGPTIAAQAQFVFVPGPGDPVPMAGMLPAQPMEDFLVRGVRKRLPHATFATNPARLRFLSQEMVIFRRDLFRQLRRLCVIEPKEEESASALVKTLADQAHFCSVPSNCLTVPADYDPLLRLYPLPHLVVIAEADHAWEATYKDCDFLCPGSLSSTGCFATYRPTTGVVEFAQLPGVAAP